MLAQTILLKKKTHPVFGIRDVVAYAERIVDTDLKLARIIGANTYQSKKGVLSYEAYKRYMRGEYVCVETDEGAFRLLPSYMLIRIDNSMTLDYLKRRRLYTNDESKHRIKKGIDFLEALERLRSH